MPGRAAFFDVDQTLITRVSIFRFLAYDVEARGLPPEEYQNVLDGLGRLKAAGGTREDANRAFYRSFAGRSVDELMDRGCRWFQVELSAGLFDPRVLTMLRGHRLAGDLIVLLSGSFPPCLTPIGRHVGADLTVCTQPEIEAGRYTGWVDVPMIGAHKAGAAQALADELGIDLDDCFAYCDDVSDLALLDLVGQPVVVGDSTAFGERRLPTIPALRQPPVILPASRFQPTQPPPSPTDVAHSLVENFQT